MKLIVPAAGKSTRFPVGRPKWLLQHPEGVTMLEKSVLGFSDFEDFDEIIIVTTTSHLDGVNRETITDNLSSLTGLDARFFELTQQTASVVETLTNFLGSLDEDISFVVKDCDNYVATSSKLLSEQDNAMVYADLHDFPEVSAPNKSFIELGAGDAIENLVEKRVISGFFSVGVTKFESASSFMAGSKLLGVTLSGAEIYISDVVRALMQLGSTFKGIQTTEYEDWGTLDLWRSFTSRYATVFVDIDGVIATNSSRISDSRNWTSFSPLEKNLGTLLSLEASGKVTIFFTTSRSELYRATLEKTLAEQGFQAPKLIMGLPHAQRVLINDFSATNPYPSAIAINVERDSDNLESYLHGIIQLKS